MAFLIDRCIVSAFYIYAISMCRVDTPYRRTVTQLSTCNTVSVFKGTAIKAIFEETVPSLHPQSNFKKPFYTVT